MTSFIQTVMLFTQILSLYHDKEESMDLGAKSLDSPSSDGEH